MFALSPRVFIARTGTHIGELTFTDGSPCMFITAAGIDTDSQEMHCLFSIEFMPPSGDMGAAWYVVWNGAEMETGVERYDVPVYVEYADGKGGLANWKGTFTVVAKGVDAEKPTVQYIDNLATKVGTSEYVTIYGHGFNDDLSVFLDRPDGTCVTIPDEELDRTYGKDGGYDTIGFIFGNPHVSLGTDCQEICGTYGVNLGYGTCDAGSIEAGSSDSSTAWENNLYLIRYRYDSDNRELSEQTPGGLMTTVDPKCFYASELELVTDRYGSDSRTPTDGGVVGSLGKDIYFRIKPGTDCTGLAYYRVRLKYTVNLPARAGELTLDGVKLNEGDLVWLDKQFDGGDGLWIVQTGEWIGLKSYLDGQGGEGSEDPCANPVQEPLPVDSNVIADLGVHVKDTVAVACDSDVPEEMRYGSRKICGTVVNPGDTVLLTNQSDGGNGVWEVTCAEWIQRTDVIPPHSGTTISGDDFVAVQNDIDFCTCEHGGKNIFHIWYYYLNGACYLARASRTVKITCGAKGTLFPSKGVDVSDYRITAEADPELVRDTRRTAGDPVKESCTEVVENYDADYRVGVRDTRVGCTGETIVAPNGMKICRCGHVYTVDDDTLFSSRDRNGFSIVFWQYDDADGKWHLYAYVGAGRYDVGMNYYVYHLCTSGIAAERDIDVNGEVGTVGTDGTSRDAWFTVHGGRLATGFGMFDDTWNFKLVDDDTDTVSYSHLLNGRTLYSTWSIKCTTSMCCARVYRDGSILRTSCKDMDDAEKTSSVMVDAIPTPDTWGFKFYRDVVSKSILCDIWNSIQH